MNLVCFHIYVLCRIVLFLNVFLPKTLETKEMPELPHVYAGLSKLFRKLGVLLHPTTCGPYLLELADPLGHLVVEWDSSWTLYPPWRQERHKDFVQRKHLHLRAEGWKLITISLDSFSALVSEQKLDFLDSFCNEQKLNYLRVGDLQASKNPELKAPSQPLNLS